MFEFNGDVITVEDIQAAADSLNMSYDDALAKLTQQGLIQPTSTNNMNLSEDKKEKQDDLSFLQKIQKGFVKAGVVDPTIAANLSTLSSFAKGAVDITDSAFDLAEFGVQMSDPASSYLYFAKRRAAAMAGVSYEEFEDQMEDPFNVVDLSGVSNFLDQSVIKFKDDDGNRLDYTQLAEQGRYSDAATSFVYEVAGAAPSMIVSMLPGGYALLGGTSFIDKLNRDLVERPDESISNIMTNAVIFGGSDAVGEYFGGRFLRNMYKGVVPKAGAKVPKGVKDAVVGGIGGIITSAFKGGSFEFMQESITSVIQSAGDDLVYGDDVSASQYFRKALHAGLIGFALGSKAGTVSTLKNRKNSEKYYEYLAPKSYKVQQVKLSEALEQAESDLQNAPADNKDVFQKRVDDIKNKKQDLKNQLYDRFQTMEQDKNEITYYLDNLNNQHKALDIITGGRKFSDNAKDQAKKDFTEAAKNNEDLFAVTDLKYDKDVELELSKYFKLASDIDNRNENLWFKAKDLSYEYLDTQEKYDEARKKYGKDIVNESDGFFETTVDGKKKIFINRDVAAMAEATNVIGHELLHYAISNRFANDPEALRASVVAFTKYLDEVDPFIRKSIEKRLANPKNGYAKLVDGKVQRDENGLIVMKKESYIEEYFNMFSDLIDKKKIKAVEEASDGIKNSFRSMVRGLGGFSKVDFKSGQEVFNLLIDYNKNINREGLLGRVTQKKIIETVSGKKVQTGEAGVSKSMTAEQRTTAENEIKRLGREGLVGDNLRQEGVGKVLFDASFQDIYSRIKSEGLLDNLIAAKFKGDVVPRDFVDKVYSELTAHAKNFNPEQNDDFFGYLNSQIANKAGNVYNREYKVDQTAAGRARDIGETTQEGEVKVQVEADTDAALEALETEDLSIVGQTKKEAQETRNKVSKFRQQLGFETGGEFYNRVLQSAKKSLLLAYNKTKNITDKSERAVAIRELIRKEYFTKGLTSDLFKPLKNFLGTTQYLNNLVEYKEAFVNAMSTADLVQIERKVAEHERVFTIFDKKLTKIEDVQDAVNKDLLPPDAINAIKKGQAVNLYKKRMPADSEIVAFANQPAINPVTGQRSGLKGTRKDGFAKAMANSLLFDAIMQVRQSSEVVEALQDDAIALGDEATLAGKIGREVDVKFSKTAQEIVADTKPLTKTMGANQIRKAGIAIDEIVRTIEKEGVDNSVVNMFEDIKSLTQQGLSVQEVAEIAWNRNGYLFEDASKYGIEGSLLTGVFDKKHLAQILANAKAITEAQVKQIGFSESVKDLQNLKNPNAIINWLKTYSKSLRTAKVIYNGQVITTNEQVHDLLIAPLGVEGFSVRKTAKGNTKIVYKGEDINTYKKIIEIKQDAKGSYDTMIEESKLTRKAVIDIVKSDKSKEIKKSLIKLIGVDQVSTLRKMAKPGIMFWNFKGETILDHRPTINDVTKKIYETIDNPTDQAIQELETYLNDTYVNLIPKTLDNQIREAGYKNKGGMEIMSTFTLKNMLAGEIYDNFSNTSVNFTKENNNVQKSVQLARSFSKTTKGISILDFDDTLATSKSLVKFTKPDGTEGTLTPEQYAATYEDLLDLGYKFDFSEFSKVVDGKPAPLLNKAKKLAEKFGTKDMFVLTARPADSAPAIKAFLDQNGLNIPLKNITGLGNSTAEAKALWVAGKAADGYNDFYFADDALKNVQAVQNMLDQFDVKSKVQQAKVNFSRTMNDEFNQMLERTKGVPFDETFSRARALRLGKNKGKFQIFVPPAADDFEGLLYYFVGKGEQGNKDLEFFKKSLIDPFSRAYTELDQSRQTIINDWDRLRNNHKEVTKKLGDMMPASEFTFDNAIRVYLYNKAGHAVPGLSEQEVSNLVQRVETDLSLAAFAENLQSILQLDDIYVKPNEYWIAGSTAADVHEVSERVRRAEFLTEWVENKNEIFNEANLNKIEATYGSRFRSALEDVLYRMETGRTRSEGSKDAIASKWMRWLNNSVGAIMFINTKSALLQTISMINYVNYVDNNPLQAARAFANQKQYWSDFSMIFNSDFLKQRRKGLKTDVQTAEIASAVANATNKAQAAVAYLLKKGFLPTQMADSFAIAAGGATFYRNRVKTYLNDGLSQKEAEEKAFNDFRNTSEESQQSARPDRLSQQQVSNAGRLLLNFQNYPMQQARLFKKAILGLARGTGDRKQHLSRIAFYGFAQNMIFLSLQNALFAMLFDDDDEEKKQELFDTKKERILNGMVDTMLRGSGIAGGVIATAKNTILRAIQELDKKGRANEANVILEATNLSPAIGSKIRKINKGFRTYKYNKDAINEMSKLNINNPIWTTAAPVIEGTTNVPTDRAIRLINQVREGFNTDNTVAQRMSLLLGFSPYEIGVDPNKEVREAKKRGRGESTSGKKQCVAFTSSGARCRNTTTNESGRCYAHD